MRPVAQWPSAAAPVELAALSVVDGPNGKVTLTLSTKQLGDPAAVRKALSGAGVPADVRVGFSYSSLPSPGVEGVIAPGEGGGTAILEIDRSAIPEGAVVTIGYRDPAASGPVLFGLAWKNRLTCHKM